MKKKFMRGIAVFLAAVMMLPTAAFADNTDTSGSVGDAAEPAVISTTDATTEVTLKILNGSDDVTNGKVTLSDAGSNSTATLTVDGDYDVTWHSTNTSVVAVSNGKLTAKGVGTATIKVSYGEQTTSCTVEVKARTLSELKVSGTPKTTYTTGDSFSFGSASVIAVYSDGSEEEVTSSCTVSPKDDLRSTDTSVTVSYKEGTVTKTASVSITVAANTVTEIDIVSPSNGSKYTVGDKISASNVSIKVTYSNGDKVTLSAADYSDITFSPNTALTVSDKTFTVNYAGKSDTIAIAVSEKAAAKTVSSVEITTLPTKTTYGVGDTLSLAGMVAKVTYSDGSTATRSYSASYFTTSTTTFTTTGTKTVTVNYKDTYGTASTTFTVTVEDLVDVYGLNTSSSYYSIDEDAEIEIGDELDWEDIFDYINISYYKSSSSTTKTNKKITDDDDLEDFLGSSAKLHLVVYGKDDDEDTIEEDDVDDGEVTLQLYLEYAGKTYTTSAKSITFKMEVADVACTVSIYSSASSSVVRESQVFDSLRDALDALEDFEDEFDISLKTTNVIKIKLGEDQTLSTSYTFAPDFDNKITIDLNGYTLKLKSEWIDYDDCEDLKVVVTNTNEDEYGTLTYSDLSTSLIVVDGTELEFTEGEIPMDSDAACMVTIYKSSTSSTVIDTKVYDDLRDALDALEDFEDEFDDELSANNVIKIKLGEDQTLSTSYKFAPAFENTITIDLNGNTLKLKSEWIDYEDCEDLVVYVTNTNEDDKATLTYTDLSNSLTVSNGDSLKFEEDKIPGIYSVTIGTTTNGKVTMSKDTVAHGGTVTFTITPNSGYAISTVKVNNKSITTSTDGYTVNSSTGVGKYEMKNITEDVTIAVTFKASSSSSTTSSSSAANWTNPFSDISSKDQYYDAVAFVCSEGLFNGMSATKFEPKTTMTRAMYVTVLGRLAGVDVSKYATSSYTDVSTSDASISYAVPYIEWATDMGIIQGYGNGKFGPKDNITHQQMYLMMYRYALYVENISTNLSGVSLTSIKDYTEIADWAEEGVKFASRYGILITSGSKLTPADNALRCELAMLLHGFCQKVLNYNG